MTKDELITIAAEASGESRAATSRVFDGIMEGVMECLKRGDSIKLGNLGTFSVQERSARTARNPATGETINVPAKKVIKFKASKPAGEALN